MSEEEKIDRLRCRGGCEVEVAGSPAPARPFPCLQCIPQPATPFLLIEAGETLRIASTCLQSETLIFAAKNPSLPLSQKISDAKRAS